MGTRGVGGGEVNGGILERRDLRGAIDFLKSVGMSESAIGVYGSSMGAGMVLLTLPGEPGIRAAVLESPYASACDLIAIEIARRTILPEWFAPVFIPGATFMARMLYDIDVGALTPKRSAAELDYPVLVIHGTADTRVPFEPAGVFMTRLLRGANCGAWTAWDTRTRSS